MNEVKYPLVYIKWVDSYGTSSSWKEICDDIPDERHYCSSVGWLVKDGLNVKVIVPHLSPENDIIDAVVQGCGEMAIPCVAIIEQKTLTI